MTQNKQNPKIEWGFFAVIPRIVRTQYKQLSHTEKWLYACLKDLCGDKGTCYRTLRVLEQETDISTGSLSTMIPKLHKAGLIHAEKKRRSNNPTAKEVWHISIVDIWQSNVEYCSNIEQQCSNAEQSPENVQTLNDNVQTLNNNVQYLNDPPPERSNAEQKRSKNELGGSTSDGSERGSTGNFSSVRNNNEEQHTEERTNEEDSFAALAPTLSRTSLLDDFALTEEDLAPENEEDITDAPTVHRLKVVRPEVEQTPLPTSKPAQETPPVHVEAVSEQDAPGQDETPSQLSPKVEELSTGYAPEQHTLMVVRPRESARLQKKVARGKPEKEAKLEPTPEEIALQERCKTWYDRITEHCGGPITKTGQVINKHKLTKMASQKINDKQL